MNLGLNGESLEVNCVAQANCDKIAFEREIKLDMCDQIGEGRKFKKFLYFTLPRQIIFFIK